jgi:hypothetical protein
MVSGSVGTDLTVTPGASPVKLPWSINKIPQRSGELFAYVPRIWMKWNFIVDQGASGTSIMYDEALGDIVHSYELRRTKFGNPWLSSDTNGQRLNLFDNRIANRYRHPTIKTPSIPTTDGDTAREIWIPLSFNYGCTEKPHHFAPPAALINGSLLDIYANANSVLAYYSNGAVWKSATLSVIVEVLWEPEARLFVPVKHGLYEPQSAGTNQRWELDLGQPKGLDGVDSSGGSGLLAMALPSSILNQGGGFTIEKIAKIQASFLGLDSFDYPSLMSTEFINSINRSAGEYWPNTEASTAAATHGATQLFFPIVMPPINTELSKIGFVRGKNELLVGFTASQSQTTHKVWTQEAFPWDPAFVMAARELMFESKLVGENMVPIQKFLRKQSDEDKTVISPKKTRLFPWTYVSRVGADDVPMY